MSYIDGHLNTGETVVHRTTLHQIIFLVGVLLSLWALSLLSIPDFRIAGAVAITIAVLVLGYEWLRYKNSEFAVTTSRVIFKIGWLSTHTLELQLAKVEALSVDQDVLGRLLNYGTLVVGGTGGTKESFKYIKAPIAFRQAVQQQTDIVSHQAVHASDAPATSPTTQHRDERECPYCAERILAKATRCRFCGQTVTPTA